MTLCSDVVGCHCFGGAYYLHLQVFSVVMETGWLSETLAFYHNTT